MDYINEFKKMLENPESVLFGFKQWDRDKRDKYIEFYNSNNPKPKENFDERGLRYDIEYLSNLGSDIILMPIDFSSNYVDVMTKENVDSQNKDFCDAVEFEMKSFDEQNFIYLNATAIGNLSYFCLFSKNEQLVNVVKKKLIQIFIWKMNQCKALIESLNTIN